MEGDQNESLLSKGNKKAFLVRLSEQLISTSMNKETRLEISTGGKAPLEEIKEIKSKRKEKKPELVKQYSWKRKIDPLELDPNIEVNKRLGDQYNSNDLLL